MLRGALSLLGQRPQPIVCATAVLALDTASASSVPAGSMFRLDSPGASLAFTTLEDLSFLPVDSLAIVSGGEDLSSTLASGRTVDVLTAEISSFELSIRFKAPPTPGSTAGFLFDLDTPDSIPPQWSPKAVANIAPPASIVFHYSSAAGWTPIADADDGTAGFRRSGLLRFAVPTDWQAIGGAYALRIARVSGRHTDPPRLRQAVANAVAAAHRRPAAPFEESMDWLPLPGLTLPLDALDQPAIPGTFSLELRERDGQWREWVQAPDLTFATPDERAFTLDRLKGTLRFGDGRTGRQPAVKRDGQPNVRGTYEVGGGIDGNVGAALPWVSLDDPGIHASNAVEATGGAEEETLDQARLRAGSLLRLVERAVTANDHEQLAVTTPGVAIARAHAAVGFHPEFPCVPFPGAVTVFVVPDSRRPGGSPAPVLDDGALAAVRNRLDNARLVASQIFVRPVRYRAVRLALRVSAGRAASLETKLRQALSNFLDPLVGGSDGLGWPFGDPVIPSAIQQVVENAAGPGIEIVSTGIALDHDERFESCARVAIGPHELVYLKSFELEIDTKPVSRGGFR